MNQYNVTTVFVTNFMGIVNLIGLAITNRYCIRQWNRDNRYINEMFLITGISCIADPISYVMIGKAGRMARSIMMICNTWMYASYIVLCIVGIRFAIEHVHVKNKQTWNLICVILGVCGFDLLAINLVVPIVFCVDRNNIFSRKSMAGLFFGLICITVLLGNAMYLQRKRCSEFVQFFPIGYLGIPLLIGTVIQYAFYGVSVLYAFETITLAMVISSIKNEYIYQDRLTGMYNQAFLTYLWQYWKCKKDKKMQYIVVYVKDLQEMDDTFGIEVGDHALLDVAHILQQSIPDNGKIVRYNRATFVNLWTTTLDDDRNYIEDIENLIYEHNQKQKKMYHLNVNIYRDFCNTKTMSLEHFKKNITALTKGEKLYVETT